LSNIQSFDRPPERFLKLAERHVEYRRFRHQYIFALFQHRGHLQKKCPKPAFGPGPLDGVANLFTGDKTDAASPRTRYRKKYKRLIVPALVRFVNPVEVGGTLEGIEMD